MEDYTIRDYERGFEPDQARIGIEVATPWVWPFAYTADELLRIHSSPDFDPGTRHYSFCGDRMVGYTFWIPLPAEEGGVTRAYLDFPRVLPGHERAAEVLVRRSVEAMKERGISTVESRVTTMWEGNVELAESTGFSISQRDGWGYKVYYAYDLARGKLRIPRGEAFGIDPARDLDDCARLAAIWYRRPEVWCRRHLEEWDASGEVLAHLAIREAGEMVAACLVARNPLRSETLAGMMYIYAPEARHLGPLLARAIDASIGKGIRTLLADLINEHRRFEEEYQALGFAKVAEWARCERALD